MKILKTVLLALPFILTTSCQSNTSKKNSNHIPDEMAELVKPTAQDLEKYETAYFASGCFWCVEAIFESVKGVKEVVSGYSGGTEKNPTYEQVGGGLTSH